MSETKRTILIVGPHVPDTYPYAAAIECMGAELDLPRQYASDENREGFFEHPELGRE